MNRTSITLSLFAFTLMLSSSAGAAEFQEAWSFFDSGFSANLPALINQGQVVDRSGHCVKYYDGQVLENRAYVTIPMGGPFGRALFASFEFFNEQSTDTTIIADSQTLHDRGWGTLYNAEGSVLQSAALGSTNFFLKYRMAFNADGERYLIRKYFADQGIWTPWRTAYIAAFDPIEFCWVKLPQ